MEKIEIRRRPSMAEVYVAVGRLPLAQTGLSTSSFEGLERGASVASATLVISLLWIFDAVRQFGADAAQKVFECAAATRPQRSRHRHRGDEKKGPPELFRDAYASPPITACASPPMPEKAPTQNPSGVR